MHALPSTRVSHSLLFACIIAAAGACASAAASAATCRASSEPEPNAGVSVEVALQRTASGLTITRSADGWIAVEVRGNTSDDEARSRPLFVVDGHPFHVGPNGTLVGLEPTEIASLRFLRPAEAGLYGGDGANGVVVIKTKRASCPVP